MKKKVIKWLIVLLFSIIICVLSICGYASLAKEILVVIEIAADVFVILFVAMMVFLETYLAKHPNPFKHEIEKRKAQQELKEEMDKRFKEWNSKRSGIN